ncbi:MAG: hypothetical protein WCG66_09815 [bacterium]
MEQLVLVLIIGAVSLINWLIEQSAKRREQQRSQRERDGREVVPSPCDEALPDAVRPVEQPDPQAEMRDWLESFGLPVLLPKTVAAPDSVLCQPDLPHPKPAASRPVAARKPRTKHLPPAPVLAPFKTRTDLRQAIIWREILGAPRSIQPFSSH